MYAERKCSLVSYLFWERGVVDLSPLTRTLTRCLTGARRYKAGQTEKVILRKLGATDPDDKRHVIRLLRNFEYRGHLCMVFEPMVR